MKIIYAEREKKDLIDQYFDCNSIKRVLKELSNHNSFNFSTSEYVGITLSGYFDKNEPEYYGERKVQFCGFQDSIENEVCGTISFEEFAEQLRIHAVEYIREHADEKEELESNLQKIEKRLLG